MILIQLFVFSILSIFTSNQGETYDLEVTVTGLSNNDGQVLLALFDSSEVYPKNPTTGGKATPKGKTAVYVFKDLPKGTYAVSTFHDENTNEKLDTNGIGIPKEDYGFSNNPNSSFGPPSFSKANFRLDKNQKIEIKVH